MSKSAGSQEQCALSFPDNSVGDTNNTETEEGDFSRFSAAKSPKESVIYCFFINKFLPTTFENFLFTMINVIFLIILSYF